MRKIVLMMLLIPLVFISVASAGSIGINLGGNEATVDSFETAGVVPQIHWNNTTGNSGTLGDLQDNAGVNTGASVSYATLDPSDQPIGGTWRIDQYGTVTTDGKLMYGYIDPIWGDCYSTATITDIPYSTYDVYVYFGTDNANAQSYVTDGTSTYYYTSYATFYFPLWNADNNIYFQHSDFKVATVTDANDLGDPNSIANYAIFAGLTGSSVTLELGNGISDNAAGLAGIQIVEHTTDACWNPTPANGETNADYLTDLSCLIPPDANETWNYTVYFDVVPDPSGATPIPITSEPNVINNLRAVSVSNAQIGGPLAVGVDYYWRVDANPNNGDPIREGTVWQFTTTNINPPTLVSPPNSYDPTIDIDADLEWTIAAGVSASQLIITPEGGSPVDFGIQSSPFNLMASASSIMQYGTKYTWQILELDQFNNVLVEGDEWHFMTKELACTALTMPEADLTGDCKINLADIAEMASVWLDCGWTVDGGAIPYPSKDPCQW